MTKCCIVLICVILLTTCDDVLDLALEYILR